MFSFSAYLDITENVSKKMQEMRDNKFQLQPANFINTFAVGYETIGSFVQDVTSSVDKNFDNVPEDERKSVASSKLRLLIGAAIVNEIRNAVKEQTKYECSAGIGHNKILAKLTCGMNKPNKQTILPIESISGLFDDLAVSKVKSLGGKLGEEVCGKLKVKTMADLLKFSESELQTQLQARVGSWLYLMARGIDLEKVTPKFMSKSIAVSKNFRGKNEISSVLTLKFWLKELSKEIVERLEKDAADCNRTSKHLVVSFTQGAPKEVKGDVASSRTVQLNGNSLNSYTAEQIAEEAFETIKKNSSKFLKAEGAVIMTLSIKHLGITAGKFEDDIAPGASKNLQNLLKNHQKKEVLKSPTAATLKKESQSASTATLSTIKQFEMKSPKPMAKVPSVEKLKPEANQAFKVQEPIEDGNSAISSSESFSGVHAIQGIKTLKHWIAQLVEQFCGKVEIDSKEHRRAPTEIVLKFRHRVGREKENVLNIPLDGFNDGFIDANIIAETLIRTEGFLKNDGSKRIQNPIVSLEIISSNFEDNKQWNYAIKSANVLSDKHETMSEIEAEAEIEHGSDDEFQELIKNELSELTEQESSYEFMPLGQPIQDDFKPISPTYSPSFDVEDEPTVDVKKNETSPAIQIATEIVNIPIETPQATGPSYLNTYAEFQPQIDAIELLNPKEACIECGKMIAKLDMVPHLDHHLAFQISIQQREEYRQQLKPKPSTPSSSSQSVVKKIAKGKNPPSKPTLNLIEKYVKKEATAVLENDESKVQCEQCRKFIANEDYVSHLDYHFAKKLRDEEMKKPEPQNAEVKEAKRKRPGSTQKNLPKMKSMKAYFAAN